MFKRRPWICLTFIGGVVGRWHEEGEAQCRKGGPFAQSWGDTQRSVWHSDPCGTAVRGAAFLNWRCVFPTPPPRPTLSTHAARTVARQGTVLGQGRAQTKWFSGTRHSGIR